MNGRPRHSFPNRSGRTCERVAPGSQEPRWAKLVRLKYLFVRRSRIMSQAPRPAVQGDREGLPARPGHDSQTWKQDIGMNRILEIARSIKAALMGALASAKTGPPTPPRVKLDGRR